MREATQTGWLIVLVLVLWTRSTAATPVLASVQPPSGPSNGGTHVTITGSAFVEGSTLCRFGPEQTVAAVVTSSTKVRFGDLNQFRCHATHRALIKFCYDLCVPD